MTPGRNARFSSETLSAQSLTIVGTLFVIGMVTLINAGW